MKPQFSNTTPEYIHRGDGGLDINNALIKKFFTNTARQSAFAPNSE